MTLPQNVVFVVMTVFFLTCLLYDILPDDIKRIGELPNYSSLFVWYYPYLSCAGLDFLSERSGVLSDFLMAALSLLCAVRFTDYPNWPLSISALSLFVLSWVGLFNSPNKESQLGWMIRGELRVPGFVAAVILGVASILISVLLLPESEYLNEINYSVSLGVAYAVLVISPCTVTSPDANRLDGVPDDVVFNARWILALAISGILILGWGFNLKQLIVVVLLNLSVVAMEWRITQISKIRQLTVIFKDVFNDHEMPVFMYALLIGSMVFSAYVMMVDSLYIIDYYPFSSDIMLINKAINEARPFCNFLHTDEGDLLSIVSDKLEYRAKLVCHNAGAVAEKLSMYGITHTEEYGGKDDPMVVSILGAIICINAVGIGVSRFIANMRPNFALGLTAVVFVGLTIPASLMSMPPDRMLIGAAYPDSYKITPTYDGVMQILNVMFFTALMSVMMMYRGFGRMKSLGVSQNIRPDGPIRLSDKCYGVPVIRIASLVVLAAFLAISVMILIEPPAIRILSIDGRLVEDSKFDIFDSNGKLHTVDWPRPIGAPVSAGKLLSKRVLILIDLLKYGASKAGPILDGIVTFISGGIEDIFETIANSAFEALFEQLPGDFDVMYDAYRTLINTARELNVDMEYPNFTALDFIQFNVNLDMHLSTSVMVFMIGSLVALSIVQLASLRYGVVAKSVSVISASALSTVFGSLWWIGNAYYQFKSTNLTIETEGMWMYSIALSLIMVLMGLNVLTIEEPLLVPPKDEDEALEMSVQRGTADPTINLARGSKHSRVVSTEQESPIAARRSERTDFLGF